MSDFSVNVTRIYIKPHPDADLLELGNIGSRDGFQVVVGKGLHEDGALVAYIGENSVIPEEILKEYGYWNVEKNVGMLGGKQGTRVKAVKLRGQFSLGIVIPMIPAVRTDNVATPVARFRYTVFPYATESLYYQEGEDVTHVLGVTKYEPPIPTQMAGEVWNAVGYTLKYDIENIKNYPDVIEEGEEVVFTEKLHGTFTCLGYHPDAEEPFVVASKGLGAKGLAFKINKINNANLYVRSLYSTELESGDGTNRNVVQRAKDFLDTSVPFYLLGETFGKGVQDLGYGLDKPSFRVFDCYVGAPGQGTYLDHNVLKLLCREILVDMVPVLYEGPFSKEMLFEHTNGLDTINGAHIREGIVIKPIHERRYSDLGRVILKSISEDYYLRKGTTTEFN